ncbi:MAG TPA: cyclic nucleotide-binding domain-containing protein [Streptosporangiaceae bacterium]|nr:cyclic nucleotide-binding domain-containing protein [Streptosporangiaceae bacterium]
MTTQEQSILAGRRFLRGMSPQHIARLAEVCKHVSLPVHYRLFEEGGTADKFWLIDAGQVALDAMVPGDGRLVIETLGRGDVVGLSWQLPPYQWHYGAITTQPMQAFEMDAKAVRAACEDDPGLGYELTRRFLALTVQRLQVTRERLLEKCADSASSS